MIARIAAALTLALAAANAPAQTIALDGHDPIAYHDRTATAPVKGDAAHPFYRWAAQELGADAKPRWNFHKYLIAPDGRLAGWFGTSTSPSSQAVLQAIEAVLPGAASREANRGS